MMRGRDRWALACALTSSGCAALLYESAWGRMLHRVLGVSDWAVATVIAAFFHGMGLGAALGGRWARRTTSPGRTYAALEAFVAIYAALSIPLVPRVAAVYGWLGADAGFAALSFTRTTLAMAILLPPTLAMGATLPVLLRTFEGTRTWSEHATFFYAANTLGAAAGAGLAGFVLLPRMGVSGTLLVAAGLSLVAAAVGARVAHRRATSAPDDAPGEDANPAADERVSVDDDLGPRLLATLAFCSGALALGGEVLFTRLLRLVIQGTSQAFAAMLMLYLGGIVLGTVAARRLVRARHGTLRAFGALQLAAAAAVVLGIGSAPFVPRLVGLLRGEAELVPNESWVLLVVAAFTLLPVALVVGTGLPLVLAMARGNRDAARTAGRLLAANTLGGLAGALGCGFFAVPVLGLEGSLYFVAVGHAMVAFVALLTAAGDDLRARAASLVAVATLFGLTASLRPSIELPFLLDAWNDANRAIVEGARGYDRSQVVFLREGRNTTVSVLERGEALRLFNDGRPESGIARGRPAFGPELVMLGGLPGMFARRREHGLVVGLGAGHSATMLLASDFQRVTVVELEAAVVDAARTLHRLRGQDFPLDDARAELVVDDARARVELARRDSYDAIVSQPSHPWLSGAGAFYTREFFASARRALRDDGVLSIWVNVFRMDVAHLRDVTRTLRDVFPHVLAFVVEDSSFLLVASETPFDFHRLGARLSSTPRLREFLADYRLSTSPEVLAALELDESGATAFGRRGRVLVDDVPRLEYALTALPHGRSLTHQELDGAFLGIPWLAPATVSRLPDHLRAQAGLYRVAGLEARRSAVARVAAAAGALATTPAARALLDGAIAETRGDVASALTQYERSADPEALARADALRLVELGAAATLGAARARTNLPSDGNALLRAAFATASREDLEFAVSVARRAGDPPEAPLVDVAEAFLRAGCPAARAAHARAASEDLDLLSFLARCAADAGDHATRLRLEEARALGRRAQAQMWFERGDEAFAGGNLPLASRFLRRTLRLWPAHRDAAEKLAEALCSLDRCADARRPLELTLRALGPGSDAARPLRQTATRLGIEISP